MSLLKKAKTKFKSKTKTSRSKKMASKQKTKRRSTSKSRRQNFVSKIPVVGRIVNDPRVRKGAQATGTVTLLTSLAKLIPNQTVQTVADNPIVKVGAAYSIGDTEGAIFQAVEQSGGFAKLASQIPGLNGGGSSQSAMMTDSGAL